MTCQVNKLTTLSSARVREAFVANDVSYVTADWTRRDAVIEAALASFGANGVPLYVVYKGKADAIVLPQPLTEAAIIAAVTG
ncbi:MAG: thioredoxin family protein [Parvularculaceae bacterium]